MDAATAITVTIQAIKTLMDLEPEIIQGIKDLKLFAVNLYCGITGEPISEGDLLELQQKVDELHQQFQQPLPED